MENDLNKNGRRTNQPNCVYYNETNPHCKKVAMFENLNLTNERYVRVTMN